MSARGTETVPGLAADLAAIRGGIIAALIVAALVAAEQIGLFEWMAR